MIGPLDAPRLRLPTTPDRGHPSMQFPTDTKRSLRVGAVVLLAPLVVYGMVRPLVSSDAAGLAIAGAIPVLYSIGLAIGRHRIDLFALVSAIGFSVACLVSLLTGGSSLPLKLHEALITFTIGLVLLVAAVIRRPLPIAHLLRVPSPTKQINSSLGAMIGGFLVLHALLHLMLAVSLSTSSYLVASRLVNWGTVGLGVLGLSAYLRRVRDLER